MVFSSKIARLWVRRAEFGYECCYQLRGHNHVIVFGRHFGPDIKACLSHARESIMSQARYQNAVGEYRRAA